MKIPFFRLIGAGLLAFLSLSLQAEPVLLGHPQLESQSLDADAIKAVLLGKRLMLGSNRVVLVIVKTSASQDSFLQASVGMNTSHFQNYWRRLFMTGGGSMPRIVETEAAACKLAAITPGAILIADLANAEGLVLLAKK